MSFVRTYANMLMKVETGQVVPDGAVGNALYEEYLAWVALGNDPGPAPAPQLVFSDAGEIRAQARTTTAALTILHQATLPVNTGYSLDLTLIAVDAGNGAVRTWRALATIKRLAGNAIQVGTTTLLAGHQDVAAATWLASFTTLGTDAGVTVNGQAGRTIDWSLRVAVYRFGPGGL